MSNHWRLQAWFRCDNSMTVCSKTTLAAPEEVSVDAAIVSVISELERISSLKEEQRTTLKAFLRGKHVFGLPDWPQSERFALVVSQWFIDLIG